MKRHEVIALFEKTRIVPLLSKVDIETGKAILKACYAGGVRVIEYTNRGARAHEVFRELKIFVENELPEMILGVGTIVEAGTASLYMQLGADFVISPILNQEIFRVCNRRKVLHIPGCATLSEISQAEEWGADIVKIFPGDTLKPNFVKALQAPMPWTSVMVTGGVEPTYESLFGWFSAGASCVGLGSQLFKKELLEAKKFDELAMKIKELMTYEF
ncbi:MAG: bifunctional 4-hydroxy-2-oxoglutarate aldolase/2-dehydro-3-deoxy-phosphogluconate aldolase [Microscillaceae bacterium]|jgi:2-dehydro-3-deoxyphosphogluconate aldolase/(4S)-4-hydroxy-2-oxoglutarate aldolase|nr:bifunctional 4-hydroxy-2-oxoglutarate aldolase/2-dehydro-3-deoxy-phosphogluconate aldolase [Microscillaceae bacterium]